MIVDATAGAALGVFGAEDSASPANERRDWMCVGDAGRNQSPEWTEELAAGSPLPQPAGQSIEPRPIHRRFPATAESGQECTLLIPS